MCPLNDAVSDLQTKALNDSRVVDRPRAEIQALCNSLQLNKLILRRRSQCNLRLSGNKSSLRNYHIEALPTQYAPSVTRAEFCFRILVFILHGLTHLWILLHECLVASERRMSMEESDNSSTPASWPLTRTCPLSPNKSLILCKEGHVLCCYFSRSHPKICSHNKDLKNRLPSDISGKDQNTPFCKALEDPL